MIVDRTTNTVKIYVNFELVGSGNLNSAGADMDSEFALNIGADGAMQDNGYIFNGVFDDVLIFNDVLTDAEIANLAAYYAN